MRRKVIIITSLLLILGLVLMISRQSGASMADLQRPLPGDNLIPNANATIDRIITLDASADDAWPWIVQLGQGRAEWYAPAWIEAIFVKDPAKRPARKIIPKFQHIAVGDVFEDYGPGKMKVLQVDSKKHILLYQLANVNQKLGEKGTITWLLALDPIDAHHSKLVIRLRGSADPLFLIGLKTFGGLFDYATIEVLEAGLNERFSQMERGK